MFVPREDYAVAWVCAITIELVAAQRILDEEFESLPSAGSNIYTCGRVGRHNVVITHLASYGTNSAAGVAAQLDIDFPFLKVRLMVGIGGGIPSDDADVRLGDVVVSRPKGPFPGVVQYDLLKSHMGSTERIGSLTPPPGLVLKASLKLEAADLLGRLNISSSISNHQVEPGSSDLLFEASYRHTQGPTCEHCDRDRLVRRPKRPKPGPIVHYGIIASGNRVIKDGTERDRIQKELGDVLCFEMEAAGLMDTFPCLVIRGICDYCDSHKNKAWQPFAAAVAAAYAQELLAVLHPFDHEKRQAELRYSFTEKSVQDKVHAIKAERIEEEKRAEEVKQRRALDFLYFPEINFRENDIEDESPRTCSWVFRHEVYQHWLAKDAGLLWVKGKPGAGKSTVMRYQVCQKEGSISERDKDGLVVKASFFFHARAGSESLQTRPLGLYRSLLYQIMQQCPEILKDFASTYNKIPASDQHDANVAHISEKELRNCLKRYTLGICKEKAVYLYIDALDESGEVAAKDLVTTFARLVLDAERVGGSLHICFSCRHYPSLDPPGSLLITMEHENQDDIETYINFALENRSEALALKEILLEKSRGVFMWTALVVSIIVELYEDGEYHAMKDRLEGVPEGLDALYDDIIQRLLLKGQRAQRIWLFEWLCFCFRPLDMKDMRWIMVLEPQVSHASITDCEKDPNFCATDKQMQKKLKSLTGGLAEFTMPLNGPSRLGRSNGQEVMQVQFIHQSVQDYLIETGFRLLSGATLRGQTYLRISTACLIYLLLPQGGNEIPSFGQAISSDNRGWHGFVEHALDWYKYAGRAEETGASVRTLLDILRQSDRSSTFLQDFCHTHNIGFPEYSDCNSICLHIASEVGLSSMARSIVECDSVDVNLRNLDGRTPLASAANGGTEVDWPYSGRSQVEVLGPIIGRVAEVIEVLLLHKKVEVNIRDNFGFTPLALAAIADHKAAVDLLRSREDIDTRIEAADGRTALSLAADCASIEVLRKILDLDEANLTSRDDNGRSVLSWAATSRLHAKEKLILLLDKSGIDVNEVDNDGRTPLSWAAETGHIEGVQNLIWRRKVNVNAPDRNGRTPLSWAAGTSQSTIVAALLLRKDIDVNAADNKNQSPLFWALKNGPAFPLVAEVFETVAALVERQDVRLDQADESGLTPLSLAAEIGFIKAFELILGRTEEDINFGPVPSHAETRLLWMCRFPIGRWLPGKGEDISKALQGHRFDMNYTDENGRTLLSWAAQRSSEDLVLWLLSHDSTDITRGSSSPDKCADDRQCWDPGCKRWVKDDDQETSLKIKDALDKAAEQRSRVVAARKNVASPFLREQCLNDQESLVDSESQDDRARLQTVERFSERSWSSSQESFLVDRLCPEGVRVDGQNSTNSQEPPCYKALWGASPAHFDEERSLDAHLGFSSSDSSKRSSGVRVYPERAPRSDGGSISEDPSSTAMPETLNDITTTAYDQMYTRFEELEEEYFHLIEQVRPTPSLPLGRTIRWKIQQAFSSDCALLPHDDVDSIESAEQTQNMRSSAQAKSRDLKADICLFYRVTR
ncbi:MAG: hypothetical protein M1820_004213 [Bogoriella megaspora]|nr:MAG: hypothetical protein M1820_004213 [Bogoriella megaspora]